MRRNCNFLPFLILSTGLLLGVVPSASATTLTVCASGCMHTTIQAALDAAMDADVITVAAGTYTESLIVNSNVTIRGAKLGIAGPTRAVPSGETILVAPTGMPAIDATVPLVLEGMRVEDTAGTAIATVDDLTLRDSVIVGTSDTINVDTVPSLVLERVLVSRTGAGSSVLADSIDTVTITGSRFTDTSSTTSHYAIEVVGGAPTALTVTDNSFSGHIRDIYIRGIMGAGPIAIRRNLFVRASSTISGIYNSSTTAIDATDNFWDCNASTPTTTSPCDALGGSGAGLVTVTPFVVVALAPVASPLAVGATAPIVATMVRNDGSAIVGGFSAADGQPGTLTRTSGTLAAASLVLSGGTAATTLTPSVGGGTVKVTLALTARTDTIVTFTARGVTATSSAAPSLQGEGTFGGSLKCTRGAWSRAGSLSSSWARDGVLIPGATSSTYVLVAGDVGHQIACRETWSSELSDPASADSAPKTIVKRSVYIGINSANAKGAKLVCGTVLKPCPVKVPLAGYVLFVKNAVVPAGNRLQVVVERKVGRRWVARRPVTVTLWVKPIAVSTRGFLAGTYRVRVKRATTATDLATVSNYVHLKVTK